MHLSKSETAFLIGSSCYSFYTESPHDFLINMRGISAGEVIYCAKFCSNRIQNERLERTIGNY